MLLGIDRFLRKAWQSAGRHKRSVINYDGFARAIYSTDRYRLRAREKRFPAPLRPFQAGCRTFPSLRLIHCFPFSRVPAMALCA